ncbi:DPP IV N-terminal domain-containing protein [Bacteroidota bacterium]
MKAFIIILLALITININGQKITQITSHPSGDWDPYWSPDGTHLCFMSNRTSNMEIWRMRADGDSLIQLTFDNIHNMHPSWSPLGDNIVYDSERNGNRDIWIIPSIGGTPKQITPDSGIDETSSWNHDGTEIFYSSNQNDGNLDIWVISVDGQNPTKLTSNPGSDYAPSISPDGSSIAYKSNRTGDWNEGRVWIMNYDGTNPREIIRTGDFNFSICWSPDSKYLAYDSNESGNYDIWIIPVEGGEAIQFTDDPADDLYPSWSPDGSSIAFASKRSGNGDIWIKEIAFIDSSLTYFGQTIPGSIPVRFAPDIIDNHFYPHSRLIFSNEGNRLYWTSFTDTVNGNIALYYSDFNGDNLLIAEEENELSEYGILNFTFLNDDNHILFGSLQPYDGLNGTPVRAVWTSEKTETGWSQPQPIESTVDTNWASLGPVSINNAGDIYFSGRKEGETAKIYCAKCFNGSYQKYEPLPGIINTGITLDPFIDFQDKYLLFAAANREDNIGIIDLYVSFKDNSGHWSNPANLGQKINTQNFERFPMLTSDGKYLFFVSSHSDHFPSTYTHYYWVDSQIIDSLSSIINVSSHLHSFPKNFNLDQNYPNPFYPKTTIAYGIDHQSFVSLKVFDVFGKKISTLVNERMQAGEYKITFDASAKPAGSYFYQLQVDNYFLSKKMFLLDHSDK